MAFSPIGASAKTLALVLVLVLAFLGKSCGDTAVNTTAHGPEHKPWIEQLSWQPRAFMYHNFLVSICHDLPRNFLLLRHMF